jgi:hypothetical protein
MIESEAEMSHEKCEVGGTVEDKEWKDLAKNVSEVWIH